MLENDLPKESYHGYASTDLYRVDPRLGNNALYKELVSKCAQRGIKVIMDIVHNHWGGTHPLLAQPVDSGWVHRWPAFTRSNYRAITQMDPYAQEQDKALMRRGWFDHPMPDLDQTNEDLQRYMIQNNLWWIEYAGLAGYRIDTYAYPDTRFMRRWTAAMLREYPRLGLVGEVWVHSVPESAYWTEDCPLFREPDSVRLAGPGLASVTDFPVRIALVEGLNEKWIGIVDSAKSTPPWPRIFFTRRRPAILFSWITTMFPGLGRNSGRMHPRPSWRTRCYTPFGVCPNYTTGRSFCLGILPAWVEAMFVRTCRVDGSGIARRFLKIGGLIPQPPLFWRKLNNWANGAKAAGRCQGSI